MQIFDLLCEMKGNTISKDVNKTTLNFDQFETNHINVNIRDNTMVDDLFKTNIHYNSYMFLLWEMCFIQNHPFHRFCAGYVCEAKQTSLIWGTGSSCQSPSQSEGGHQPTKSQNMSFRHFRTFSLLKKSSEHCFSLGLQKYFSVLHLWNELYWQPVSHYLLLFMRYFQFPSTIV